MNILLKDNTTYEVDDLSTSTTIIMDLDTIDEVNRVTESLEKDDNLSEFKFTDGEDNVYGIYKDYTYVSTKYSKDKETGKFKASFELRQYTDMELRMAELEKSQMEQDEAIVDLADIMGGIE